jgi:hypothetical protein
MGVGEKKNARKLKSQNFDFQQIRTRPKMEGGAYFFQK